MARELQPREPVAAIAWQATHSGVHVQAQAGHPARAPCSHAHGCGQAGQQVQAIQGRLRGQAIQAGSPARADNAIGQASAPAVLVGRRVPSRLAAARRAAMLTARAQPAPHSAAQRSTAQRSAAQATRGMVRGSHALRL